MCAPGLIAFGESPQPVDGDHYPEMAGRLRALARITRSPGIRRELVDLAGRYDRRGGYFDRAGRKSAAVSP